MNEIRDRLASELRRHAVMQHLSFTDQAALILRDVFRAVLLEEAAAPLWTVADHDTYATLHRPDGTIAARFHVIAEAHDAARAMNAFRLAEMFGGAKE